MKVLSLFDGISGARQALKELNIENCVLITDDGLINLFNY